MTLGFEWEVYTGKRNFRWSFCVYVVCRLFALAAIILAFIGFNVTAEIDCNAWFRSLLVRIPLVVSHVRRLTINDSSLLGLASGFPRF